MGTGSITKCTTLPLCKPCLSKVVDLMPQPVLGCSQYSVFVSIKSSSEMRSGAFWSRFLQRAALKMRLILLERRAASCASAAASSFASSARWL